MQKTQSYQRFQCIGHTDFNTSGTNAPRSLSRVKAGTHSALLKESHTTAHTPKQGAFRMGVVSLPSDRSTRFRNPAWPGIRKVYFAAFGPWPRVLPKNAESLRDSDAHDARRCPEASRPRWAARLFYFCLNCGLYALRSGPFRVCETRGGITTLGVLCVLLKRWTAACQKGSFAAF